MKIKIDRIALDFMATAVNVTQNISPEAVLYWARNEEKLSALLEIKNFEPIVPIARAPYFLDSVPEMDKKSLWAKRLIPDSFFDTFIANVPEKISMTRPAEVYSYQMNIPMFAAEMVEEMGSVDDLMHCAFTYSQIAALASRHRLIKSKSGILDYVQPNYFPMIRRDGMLTFVSLFSRNEFNRHKKWHLWFRELNIKKYLHGVIMIRQDVENANLRL